MDRLSILINPATANGEPCVAGTITSTLTIAEHIWDGWSLSDICIIDDKLNALAIFNACWFESNYGSKIWQLRWNEWRIYAYPFLKEEDIMMLQLPPQKLEFVHNPYSAFVAVTHIAKKKTRSLLGSNVNYDL